MRHHWSWPWVKRVLGIAFLAAVTYLLVRYARTVDWGEVRNSVVGRDCRITESAALDSCIVGEGVDIRNPLEVRNAVIVREDSEAPHDPTYRYEDGLVIYQF